MECSGLSDREWVARILEGDTALGNEFVERMQPVVSKIVRGRVTRRSEGQDLIQAVFLNVFSSLEQYSGKAPLEHWVSRIAVNSCLNAIAAEKARPELRRADLSEEQAAVIDHLAATTDDLGADEKLSARDLLGHLLEALKPAERLVIDLLHLQQNVVERGALIDGHRALMPAARRGWRASARSPPPGAPGSHPGTGWAGCTAWLPTACGTTRW